MTPFLLKPHDGEKFRSTVIILILASSARSFQMNIFLLGILTCFKEIQVFIEFSQYFNLISIYLGLKMEHTNNLSKGIPGVPHNINR